MLKSLVQTGSRVAALAENNKADAVFSFREAKKLNTKN
jgi:hypothetical protein